MQNLIRALMDEVLDVPAEWQRKPPMDESQQCSLQCEIPRNYRNRELMRILSIMFLTATLELMRSSLFKPRKYLKIFRRNTSTSVKQQRIRHGLREGIIIGPPCATLLSPDWKAHWVYSSFYLILLKSLSIFIGTVVEENKYTVRKWLSSENIVYFMKMKWNLNTTIGWYHRPLKLMW